MPMTVVDAKKYVARIIGGGAESPETLDMADESLRRSYQDWQASKFWRFLLRDTSQTTPVTITATKSSAVITPSASGVLDFVNVGQTVTYVGSVGTLTAGTTVSSFTRNTDGTIATVTLSNAFGGGSYTTETGVLTFSADIPIIQGTNEYNVPSDFNSPAGALMLVNKRTLTWREQRWFDRTIHDQTTERYVDNYTVSNPLSELTQNFGTKRLRFEGPPTENDTLRLRYYRAFNPNGTYVDMPDEYLYMFLDYARNILLATKRAHDDPEAYARSVLEATQEVKENDEEPTDDNDADFGIHSQYEAAPPRRLWSNGQFDDYYY